MAAMDPANGMHQDMRPQQAPYLAEHFLGEQRWVLGTCDVDICFVPARSESQRAI